MDVAGNDKPAIGGEGHTVDPGGMPMVAGQEVATLALPQAGCVILRASEHILAIGGEGHTVNRASVACEDAHEGAILCTSWFCQLYPSSWSFPNRKHGSFFHRTIVELLIEQSLESP